MCYLFEQESNLAIVNSSLTPSLYEIPDYIEVLKYYYEQDNSTLKEETKEYFLNYSQNSEAENEIEAQNLIDKYQERELLREHQEDCSITFVILLLLLVVSFGLFGIIYYCLGKKIKAFYFKLRK